MSIIIAKDVNETTLMKFSARNSPNRKRLCFILLTLLDLLVKLNVTICSFEGISSMFCSCIRFSCKLILGSLIEDLFYTKNMDNLLRSCYPYVKELLNLIWYYFD